MLKEIRNERIIFNYWQRVLLGDSPLKMRCSVHHCNRDS
jgi:hypothetical protein